MTNAFIDVLGLLTLLSCAGVLAAGWLATAAE